MRVFLTFYKNFSSYSFKNSRLYSIVERNEAQFFSSKAKTTTFFLEIKNGGRGIKPTYIFLVIIPLLVIELKATPNGNPSDDFLLEAEI